MMKFMIIIRFFFNFLQLFMEEKSVMFRVGTVNSVKDDTFLALWRSIQFLV